MSKKIEITHVAVSTTIMFTQPFGVKVLALTDRNRYGDDSASLTVEVEGESEDECRQSIDELRKSIVAALTA